MFGVPCFGRLTLNSLFLHFCFSLKKQRACCSFLNNYPLMNNIYTISTLRDSLSTDHCQLLRGEYRARTDDPLRARQVL